MSDRIFPCDISGICPYQFEHCPSCHGYTQEELLAQTEDNTKGVQDEP